MWKSLLLLLVTGMLCRCAALAQGGGSDLAIVVNPASSLDNVTMTELAKIFRAEKQKSSDGVKFILAARESGCPERVAALKFIYGMTDAEYERYFLQATFAGTIQSAPKLVSGAAAARQFVAATPGAICYLRATDVNASVKTLKVDGKAPGDAGYPIQIK